MKIPLDKERTSLQAKQSSLFPNHIYLLILKARSLACYPFLRRRDLTVYGFPNKGCERQDISGKFAVSLILVDGLAFSKQSESVPVIFWLASFLDEELAKKC